MMTNTIPLSAPVPLRITAPTDVALMQALLDRVIALLTPIGDDAPDHPAARSVIGFRSVAVDLAALASLVVEDALAEADAQGVRVVAADVSGVMRTDEGWRCWGFLDVEPDDDRAPIAVRLESVTVERMERAPSLAGTVWLKGARHDR